jgi:hypothetical protein
LSGGAFSWFCFNCWQRLWFWVRLNIVLIEIALFTTRDHFFARREAVVKVAMGHVRSKDEIVVTLEAKVLRFTI